LPQTTIRSGELIRRVTLQKPIYNSPRDEIVDWQSMATLWAAVEPQTIVVANRAEKQEAAREISLSEAIIRIRTYASLAIDTTGRVLHGSEVYDIRDVADVLTGQTQTRLTCRRVQ
jgi:head-tail adaptor